MDVNPVIDSLKREDWYEGQIEHLHLLPEREAKYGKVRLNDQIQNYLKEEGIRLFSHQVRAVELIKEGKQVIITTPTASGKTLAFNLPVFESMIEDSASRALYLYPTKALSQDQLQNLKELESGLDLDLNPRVYDGDTPRSRRPIIRKNSRIVVSNPYGFHRYLEWHHKWQEFFANLNYVILDEVHTYRGVFGSNVAQLVRRMKRVFNHYGSKPQFILSSATVANPLEHATNLTGEDFSMVSKDCSFRGRKHFLFWNCLRDPDASPHNQTSKLVSFFTERGFQTLCFTLSRRLSELVAEWSTRRTDKSVMAYRAGYRPEERREIEEKLRNGEVRAVASTNALEVGIDIGGLDVVIMSGYPGSITSSWQQAGRAGRDKEDSVVILVGFENPLDQFFLKHPQQFFERDSEHPIVDLGNPNITMGHLACAATELPIGKQENLRETYFREIEVLIEEGVLQEAPSGALFVGDFHPSEVVDLDNIGGTTVEVLYNGKTLETMNLFQAYREAHRGATLLHQSRKYLVEKLDLEEHVACVKLAEMDYFTQPVSEKSIQLNQLYEEKSLGDTPVGYGAVTVTENYTHYKRKKYDQVIGVYPLDLPPLEFDTECSWFRVPEEVLAATQWRGLNSRGGLHAIEHALIALVPFYAMCDRWDIGGFSGRHHHRGGGPIYIYGAYEGGIGIAEKIYRLMNQLLQSTLELIGDCDCQEGCPSCIYSPKCGNDNEPLDKEAAVFILKKLEKYLSSGKNRT